MSTRVSLHRSIAATLAVGSLLLTATGCPKKTPDNDFGDKTEEAAEDVGDKVEEVGE